MDTSASDVNLGSEYDLNHIFATLEQKENEIYPPTIKEIAEDQCRIHLLKPYFEDDKPNQKHTCISLRILDDTEVLVHNDNQLIIAEKDSQVYIMDWCHHYCQLLWKYALRRPYVLSSTGVESDTMSENM